MRSVAEEAKANAKLLHVEHTHAFEFAYMLFRHWPIDLHRVQMLLIKSLTNARLQILRPRALRFLIAVHVYVFEAAHADS